MSQRYYATDFSVLNFYNSHNLLEVDSFFPMHYWARLTNFIHLL